MLVKIKYLIFFLPFTLLIAQTKLDTVFEQIKNLPDTVKIKQLIDFTWKNRNKETQLALESGKEALRIAERIGLKKYQAEASNLIGVIYRDKGEYEVSLSLYLKALQFAQEAQDGREIAYSLNNIGGIYRLKGNYPLAIEYILKSLKKFEERKDKEGSAFCTINIGLVYRRQHNYEKALEYFRITYNLRDEIGDRNGKAQALSHIAEVFSEQGNYDEALKQYMLINKEYESIGDKRGLLSVWGGIATIYNLKKDYTKALEYQQQALNLSISMGNIEGQITNHSNIALLYARKGLYGEGENHLRTALNYAVAIKSNYLKLGCYKAYAQFYQLKADYKNAFVYSQSYALLKDSLINKENSSLIVEMEAVYNRNKTERANALLQKDLEISEKQRNYWFIISLLVVVLAVFIYRRYYSKKTANKKLEELNRMKDKLFGIISHDLKNPFNVIGGFSQILLEEYNNLNDDERRHYIQGIDTTGKQTYRLLENLLYWSRSQTGELKYNPVILNLNDVVNETILFLESQALQKKIKLNNLVAENIEVFADDEMIKTVLRNLISNGIKFTDSSGQVSISAELDSGYYKINIEDTGVGIDEKIKDNIFTFENVSTSKGTAGEKGTGLGLALCKEFVEKNSGKIWVKSEIGKGSKFTFTLPVKN